LDGFSFKLIQYYIDLKSLNLEIAFTVEENHWKGNVTYYLNIRDVKFH